MTGSASEPERPVEQFFRSVERPTTPESRFTPQDVADIVRRDRDASNWFEPMLVVADASVLVPALADTGPTGDAVRSWLTELAGPERMHVVQTLTQLEVISSLRKLVALSQLDEDDAERALRDYVQLPMMRHEVTQPMVVRIWEMRGNVTPYDAAYVALVERLASEHHADACLATADAKLQRAPGLSIDIQLFTV